MPLFSTSFRGDNRAFAKFAQDSVAAPCGQMPRESGDDVGARSASLASSRRRYAPRLRLKRRGRPA